MEQPVTFSSFDGARLAGIVSTPTMNPRALALLMHGIPSDMDEWGFYKDMASVLGDHGIASLRFDFRTCGKSQPGSLSTLTLSQMINDIESAYWELMRKFGQSIPVYAVGTSCGGGVSVRWSNVFGRNLARIFLMAPVLDYEFEVTGKRRAILDNCHASLSDQDQSELATKGMLNKDIGYGIPMVNEAHIFDARSELGTARPLITIFQGDADSVVPISITRSTISDLPRIELVVVPSADHGFAVEGDDDLSAPGTKVNHRFVYDQMIRRVHHDYPGR
jgi:pimeloyl-ACP methyl ester carboxylesterase